MYGACNVQLNTMIMIKTIEISIKWARFFMAFFSISFMLCVLLKQVGYVPVFCLISAFISSIIHYGLRFLVGQWP